MKMIFNFILVIVDFFYKKDLNRFLKKNISNDIKTLVDVGSHKGETILYFLKNFNVSTIYSFEASKNNYIDLKKNSLRLKKKYKHTIIEIFNLGVGNSNEQKIFHDLSDSNSSTFREINQNSSYFKRKNKILSFFFKKNFFINDVLVKQIKLISFLEKKKIEHIDILKIDTEGYELEVLKGLGDKISIIDTIYFEHHYDNMIKKNYKFSDINDLLKKNSFYQVFKIKMPLRKSFDYIYRKKIV